MTNNISSEINLSRDKIRNQIIEYLRSHLELENVDLTKSSFLSYIINLLSTLTSNILFYQSSIYREFYLTTAQLPESVYNLSAFLGYNISKASYSTANLLVTIPFGFSSSDITFKFPEGHRFYASNIVFQTYYETEVNVINNSNAIVTIHENVEQGDGLVPKTYNIPVNIDTTADQEFSFVLPVRQLSNVTQEFQIDSDLKKFQFVDIKVPIDGKVSDLIVEVMPPGGTSWELYQEFSSLYLMDLDTYGYTYRTTTEGVTITFGNGLMGVQPTPGSTVRVTAKVTKGSDGNVITGSITSGDRVYVNDNGQTTILNYEVINAFPASGGDDEESLEEIRSNAISNLKSLGRLVSSDDYQNIQILKEKYLTSNVLNTIYPLLKRSDLKVNEISLYITMNYGSELVLGSTIYNTFPIEEDFIPRGTRLDFKGNTYVTLFDLRTDLINKVAYYDYVINSLELTPLLIRTYETDYNIVATNLEVSKELDDLVIALSYRTTEPDFNNCTCEIEIVETNDIYPMINDSDNKQFVTTITPYTKILTGNFTYQFTISSPDGTVGTYSSEFMIREDLNDIMQSNLVSNDSTSVIIYDIPVIHEDYYNQLELKQFESTVLQELIRSFYTLNQYRMLTDFINMKFSNTFGTTYGMLKNNRTGRAVIDIVDKIPTDVNDGDRYIFENTNEIITCSDSTSLEFIYVKPLTNDILYVINKETIYIFNGSRWVQPIYNIPLELELEIFPDSTFDGNAVELSNYIKSKLLNEFSERFGSNINLYRSEIIKSVQEIEDINYCNLLKPESDIFFDFSTSDLTQTELLEYVPDYIYFREDTITIRVL